MNLSDLKINTPLCLSLSLFLGLMIGYLDFHALEVQPAVLFILIATGALGFLHPTRAWCWAILLGIGVPLIHFVALAKGIKPNYPINGYYWVVLLPQIPSFIGAYSGVALRKLASSF